MSAGTRPGIDAGTSTIEAVAFDTAGNALATTAGRNRFDTGPDGDATQSPAPTWNRPGETLQGAGGTG